MANIKLNIKSVLYVLCFSGFLYQCYDFYSEYMSGKTVVNIKVETILNQTLPAITVCFSSYYSIDSMDKNDSIVQDFHEYENANYEQVQANVHEYLEMI